MKEDPRKDEEDGGGCALALGLSLGTLVGLCMDNLALGMSLGLCLGLAAGSFIGKKKDGPSHHKKED